MHLQQMGRLVYCMCESASHTWHQLQTTEVDSHDERVCETNGELHRVQCLPLAPAPINCQYDPHRDAPLSNSLGSLNATKHCMDVLLGVVVVGQ